MLNKNNLHEDGEDSAVQVLEPISDPVKMRNTKCKRTKNLAKKCIELSQLCELEINLTIYDKKRNKIQEICTSNNITLKKIVELLQEQSLPKQPDAATSLDTSRVLKYKFRLAQDLLAGKMERYVAVAATPSFPETSLLLGAKHPSSGSSVESAKSIVQEIKPQGKEQVLGKRQQMQKRPSQLICDINEVTDRGCWKSQRKEVRGFG